MLNERLLSCLILMTVMWGSELLAPDLQTHETYTNTERQLIRSHQYRVRQIYTGLRQ